MLNVHYTVDVEVWCNGWNNLDAEFAAAYASHIDGRTPKGDFGVGFQAQLLKEHGLRGVFFIEPLFTTRFGHQPLQDIVGQILGAGQDAQLHAHTEWLDEAHEPMFPHIQHKRQHIRLLPLDEQVQVLQRSVQLLQQAGVKEVSAFRAGGFGFNMDTLRALAQLGIAHDSSYNACINAVESGLRPGEALVAPLDVLGLQEHPVTVFSDGLGKLRPVQITACAWAEIEAVLWQGLEEGWPEVVIVSHGFELLDQSRERLDPIALSRFRKLCAFLDRHRDSFRTGGFGEVPAPPSMDRQPDPLRVAPWRTGWRVAEQAWRRVAY